MEQNRHRLLYGLFGLLLIVVIGLFISLYHKNKHTSYTYIYRGNIVDSTYNIEMDENMPNDIPILKDSDAYVYGKVLLSIRYGKERIDSMILNVELINDTIWSVYTTHPCVILSEFLEKIYISIPYYYHSSSQRVNFRKDNGKILQIFSYK